MFSVPSVTGAYFVCDSGTGEEKFGKVQPRITVVAR
jgi:hypothetical protein